MHRDDRVLLQLSRLECIRETVDLKIASVFGDIAAPMVYLDWGHDDIPFIDICTASKISW
jgi:hypothetical protein